MAKKTSRIKSKKRGGSVKKSTKRNAAKSRVIKRKKLISGKKKIGKKAKAKVKAKAIVLPKLPIEPIGKVTHYFPHVKATAVMIEREGMRVGDTLFFKGHTTQFKQKIESLQVNRQAVKEAAPGEEVGIRVRARTREHDLVFKL